MLVAPCSGVEELTGLVLVAPNTLPGKYFGEHLIGLVVLVVGGVESGLTPGPLAAPSVLLASGVLEGGVGGAPSVLLASGVLEGGVGEARNNCKKISTGCEYKNKSRLFLSDRVNN